MASGVAAFTHLISSAIKYLFPGSTRKSPYGLPLPAVSHQLLSEEELGGRNLLVVGDVHGCYGELVELLDRCNGRDPNLCVIFVGDLMNKGPSSAEVVRLVREMGAICVRGNHDEVSLSEWQKHLDTGTPLPPKFQWLQHLSKDDLTWAYELPYTISIPSRGIIVAHAGLVPGIALAEQDPYFLTHLRDLIYSDKSSKWTGLKAPVAGSVPWASVWTGPEVVYFGHDARRNFQNYQYAVGLDTGCVYGGQLTAVFPFEDNRLVQVGAHTVHQQPSGGRKEVKDEEGSGGE